jgi:hypothetical protein
MKKKLKYYVVWEGHKKGFIILGKNVKYKLIILKELNISPLEV